MRAVSVSLRHFLFQPRFGTTFFVSVLFCLAGRAFAERMPTKSSLSLIEGAFERREISPEERVILRVRAVRAPESLPMRYFVSDTTTLIVSHCATDALIEALRERPQLSARGQTELDALLARPAAQTSWSPAGSTFKFHYDVSGINAVPVGDLDTDGIPDYVERMKAYADSSFSRQITMMGYAAPPSDGTFGGDSRYDIYMQKIGFYGYAQPETAGPQSWDDWSSFLVIHSTFAGFPANDDPEGDVAGAAKATIAHEFFHAIQFGYRQSDDIWYMEGTATWMEEVVFDQVNDCYSYLPFFYNSPQTALTLNTGARVYATFLWPLYLAADFDASLIRASWEGAKFKKAFAALADSLPARYGVTRDAAAEEFLLWAYFTDARSQGGYYEEGSQYPPIMVARTISSYPTTQTHTLQVGGYGELLTRFLPGGEIGDLHLSFTGSPGCAWSAYVIGLKPDGEQTTTKISLSSGSGSYVVEDFGLYTDVTILGMNLTGTGFDTLYAFSASVVAPAGVYGIPLGDTVAYSGLPNTVAYQVHNTGALTDSFIVSVTQLLGWNVAPSFSKLILSPAADSVRVFTLTTPAATPPGVTNLVRLSVQSMSAPALMDSSTVAQRVQVYHGDANWDGGLDIGDVTYLVAVIFQGGSLPQPDWSAGDANCDASVDIGDMAWILAYMFSGGDPPPCNPLDTY